MPYSRYMLFSDEILPRDELDDLFDRLEQLEPPPSLIARILNSISQLPLHNSPRSTQSPWWDTPEHLVIRREELPPS